jgi:branched-chain amino acid aminotransferase
MTISATGPPHPTITGPTSATPVCWAGGAWTSLSRYGLTIATQGLHYGTGVFEGIRAYWSERDTCAYVVRLTEHVTRLLESCRLVRIDIGLTAAEVRDIVLGVVERNAFPGDLYIRPLAFKSRLAPGTPFGVGLDGVEELFAVYATPMPSREELAGVRCGVSSWRRVPGDCIPARAKISGSYVNVALAVDEARTAGFDDAILLNTRGTVAEASTANVFVVSRDALLTPSLDCDILEGQTRACVLEIAADLGMATSERPLAVSELYSADEVFLTGTGCEIVSVEAINGRPVGDGGPRPAATRIFDAYRAAVRRDGDRHDREQWTTKVVLERGHQPLPTQFAN